MKTLRETEQLFGEYPDGFWKWLAENEHIYQEFVKLALMMLHKGRQRWSASGIVEVLRWHTGLQDTDPVFKINNNYRSGMARLAMVERPELNGFFELRSIRT